MIELQLDNEHEIKHSPVAKVAVIGIGGAGGNAVNTMVEANFKDIKFIAANTDSQALRMSKASHVIQLGVKSTKGLGTGAQPEVGRRAAEEDLEKIMEAIGDSDIVFITAGMGGGTGSGASPVIAKALRERGILTIAIVTKPFTFEGRRRSKTAADCLETLKKEVDTLLVIPNQKLLEVVGTDVSMINAFGMINEILNQSVRGISDIITRPGHINVDFADLRTIIKDMGIAVMGTGKATGVERAKEAALRAISSPLLENMNIKGAKSVLLNITGGNNLGIFEISEAASIIYEQADEDAHIILGSVIDQQLTDEVIVTIIATGFSENQQQEKVKVKATKLDVDIKSEPILTTRPVEAIKINQEITSNSIDTNDLDVPAFLRQNQDTLNS